VNKKITQNQAKDAGLAIVLVLLLVVLVADKQFLLFPAVVMLVMAMTYPGFFSLWAKVWFGFSHMMGTIVSKILLSLVFWLMAVPVGLVRRALGADPMMLRQWKNGGGSVFVERNQTIAKKDIERPY